MDLVVLTDHPGLWVASGNRILKPDEAVAVNQLSELLAHGQARDKMLLRQSVQAFEAERVKGYELGLAQARNETAAHLCAISAARYTALVDLSPTLVDIVMEAVGLLTRGGDRTWLLAKALEAVSGLLKQARWARLTVHPSQLEAAHRALEGMPPQDGFHRLISVEADVGLGLEDCLFETDAGIADASLEVQLNAIRASVAQAVADFAKEITVERTGVAPRSEAGDSATP